MQNDMEGIYREAAGVGAKRPRPRATLTATETAELGRSELIAPREALVVRVAR
jgi:hypothetical protein